MTRGTCRASRCPRCPPGSRRLPPPRGWGGPALSTIFRMQRAGSAEAGQRDLVPLFVHGGQAGFGEEGRILDYYLYEQGERSAEESKMAF